MRELITFKVPYEVTRNGEKIPHWLTEDFDWSDQESEAVEFSLYRSPTIRERHKLDVRVHELAGGLAEFLDLQIGMEQAHAAITRKLVETLWPLGRPEAEGAELAAQEQKISDAFDAFAGIEKRGWRLLNEIRMKLEFMAYWDVCAAMVPKQWRKLSELTVPDEMFYLVWNAFVKAQEAQDLGNSPSSKLLGLPV